MSITMQATRPVSRGLARNPGHRWPAGRQPLSQRAIYALLVFWAFVSLFPIYWTLTTSLKNAVNVTQGHLIPFVDFAPDWKGWRSLGLSPDTFFQISTVRAEFLRRFLNSIVVTLA